MHWPPASCVPRTQASPSQTRWARFYLRGRCNRPTITTRSVELASIRRSVCLLAGEHRRDRMLRRTAFDFRGHLVEPQLELRVAARRDGVRIRGQGQRPAVLLERRPAVRVPRARRGRDAVDDATCAVANALHDALVDRIAVRGT